MPTSDAWTSAEQFRIPGWANALLPDAGQRKIGESDSISLSICAAGDFCLISAASLRAGGLAAGDFQKKTREMYDLIRAQLQKCSARHPVRIWNHLPGIHTPTGDGSDRYMAFNAGRFEAYCQWFGGAEAFDRLAPAASAVGHEGVELVIHALASLTPGVAIANPRQIAPYRYSRRFGLLPPCFARATALPAEPGQPTRVLVGGTASIRGEDSVHLGDLDRQIEETFENLAVLIRAADGSGAEDIDGRRKLDRFRHLRIYHVREQDRERVRARAVEAFSPTCKIEFLRADLCRADLLVEIEGLAEIECGKLAGRAQSVDSPV